MRYVSTRGAAPELDFEGVLLAGLAPDGGLYVPAWWPQLSPADLRALRGRPYAEVAAALVQPFVGTAISGRDLAAMTADACSAFRHPAVAPLRQLDDGLWLLELFHGPTLAFKDVALQLVGRLFAHALARRGRRMTVVGATSGDTGPAAIAACRDRAALSVFILHPEGRVSEVQRRQMTTVAAANVHNIALAGTFDDCQDAVKAMFGDAAFREEMSLGAINSINWARIMAQIVYYVTAAVALGAPDRAVAFAVPTGNFGNVYAAYAAQRMGLPVTQLIVGSNRNDILARYFDDGVMAMAPVVPTLSPSMDIQVSSNFERLLFELLGRDGAAVAAAMAGFRSAGRLEADRDTWRAARRLFDGHSADDDGTLAVIGEVYRDTGELVDPHTAVGLAAARACRRDAAVPAVALACAHAAKFPDAVAQATGVRPALPPHLADLFGREERMAALPADVDRIKDHIRSHAAAGGET